jgi:hypothetical protein
MLQQTLPLTLPLPLPLRLALALPVEWLTQDLLQNSTDSVSIPDPIDPPLLASQSAGASTASQELQPDDTIPDETSIQHIL